MLNQILLAGLAITIAIAVTAGYFVGSNWLLDRILHDRPDVGSGRRASLQRIIRPWLFIGPALLILGLYLVYPVVQTVRLSFYDANGANFVGLSNYIWAYQDADFIQAIGNNIMWLIIVPTLCTVFGIIVAVLSDRVWWGTFAKSLIFMPMAISFVGASVIWKFVYAYRGTGVAQIGALNALVVAFGGVPQAWMTLPFWNNLLLMVILIWIQTGFAMVILSAALRGVSTETLEAARIDGANEVQIFFAVMMPQVMGTVVVVWTTITIVVLKVFDIVLAMTNGQWDTEVLANLMFDWMFRGGDSGRGSTIAIMILLAVIPIMAWNIRRLRQEETRT